MTVKQTGRRVRLFERNLELLPDSMMVHQVPERIFRLQNALKIL